MFVVLCGVEYCLVVKEECLLMFVECKMMLYSGDLFNDKMCFIVE